MTGVEGRGAAERADAAAAVAPGVWRITTPLPFRPREVHAYLIGAGDTFALVDGGIDTPEAWAALDAGVRAVAGGWERVATLVVTHMHLDHMGLARRVRAASGATVVMSRLDAERARHADAHPDEEAEYRERLLRTHGAPGEVIAAVQEGRARAAGLSTLPEVGVTLDGEAGALPGCPGWDWVWTPGHTAGHLSLFRPADGVLIAGDAVLPRITPTIGVNRQREDPVGDYLSALDRLDALEARLALPGHGAPIPEVGARIAELRAATLGEGDAVAALLDREPRSAWAVAALRHPAPDLPAALRMLAFRETLAHLDRLVPAGRAARDVAADGTVRFRPTGT